MPEVSVIIPMFNARATIERSISSAARQEVDLEIIVVDDCSTDGSAEHVESISRHYSDKLKLLRTERTLGVSGARNLAIAAANSPFVAFLDADDLWLNEKLSRQLEVIRPSNDVAIVSCDCLKVSPTGQILGRSHNRHPPASGTNAWKTLLSYNFMPTPSVLTRTEMLHEVGSFSDQLVVAEDLDLWIRLGQLGRIEVIEEVFVHYFDYEGSLMKRSGRESILLVSQMINDHMNESGLPQGERRSLIAKRYYELGKHSLGYGDEENMRYCFTEARAAGFSKSKIALFQAKQKLKSLAKIERSK